MTSELPPDDAPSQRHASGDDLAWIAKQARAHALVLQAVRAGKLERKPCEVCGAGKTDAHHDDYDKPLEVRWLCRLHHREQHSQGPRRIPFGTVSLRALRSEIPDEVCFVIRRDEGMIETVALWIPIELVDA